MMTDLASTTPQSLGRDPMVGLRLARVDGFEPAIALGQDELPAYLRRFTMLFADDATMRRGGIGRVTRAVNAQGEAVALKQLILPARDEFDDDGRSRGAGRQVQGSVSRGIRMPSCPFGP